MGSFSVGLHDLGRGLAFLRQHPRLWRWVLAPALATLVLLVGAGVLVARLATRVTAGVESHLPAAIAHVVGSLLMVLIVLVLAATALFVAVTVVGIVAGPFCEKLSEVVEEIHRGAPVSEDGGSHFFRELGRSAVHSVKRLRNALFGTLFLFALSFIPVIGHIAVLVLGGYFASRAAAYDCYDALLSRRALSYQAKLDLLAAHRGRSLGLGFAVTGLMLVPVVNLLVIGIGTIGGTLALLDGPPAETLRDLVARRALAQ